MNSAVIKIVVIGVGNPLRGDDGAGPAIIKALQEAIADPRVHLLAVHQPLPELAATIAAVGVVIFVDAHTQGAPGEVSWGRIEAASTAGVTMHQLTPAATIELARAVFGFAGEAYRCTIAGSQFDLGESLSAPVRKSVTEAVTLVLRRVRHLLSIQEMH